LCVVGKSAFKIRRQADIIHNQTTWLISEDTVDPGNSLHQPVALHGLNDIHGVKARSIESGQPHIPDDDDLERIIRIFKALGDLFPALFAADVHLPFESIPRPFTCVIF
jgi:hypothetical protein